MGGLGGASNYPPGCSGPPEHNDPHPWSEELWGVLEDAGIEEEIVSSIVEGYDKALEEDHSLILSEEDLLRWASLCMELGREQDRGYYAVFWYPSKKSVGCITGATSYVDCIVKVVYEIVNTGFSTPMQRVADRLVGRVDDETWDKVTDILSRTKTRCIAQSKLYTTDEHW